MTSHLTNKSSVKRGRRRLVVAGALVCAPLLYFFPALLGKVTLAPGDGWTQILGIRILIGEMLRAGELPLWNPYIFAGMPLLAAIQPGALYPPTWLFAVLPPQLAMNVLVITTYHLALVGTYLYARRIGITRIGAIIAGIAFAFGGYMIAHLGHTNRINAAAWLPWILLAVESCWENCRDDLVAASGASEVAPQPDSLRSPSVWRWAALGALFIALQMFAGEPQMTLYTMLVMAAYILFAVLARDGQRRALFVAAMVAMVAVGVLLSMIELLPARELLQLGDRAGIDYQYFSQYSFPPRQLLSLLFPYFFGGAALAPYRVPYWGQWNSPETCGYVGMAPWMLALVGVFAARWKSKDDADRLTRFWMGCAAVALLLAFGAYLPLRINRALHQVPVYNLFRASGRNLMEFNFAVGILAGFGATALARLDRAQAALVLRKSILLVATVVGVGIVTYRFLGRWLAAETAPPSNAASLGNAELWLPLLFFVLSAMALIIAARRWGRASSALLVAIFFLDAMSFGFFYEWRLVNYDVAAKLADSPLVKSIKARESDLNSFRVLSQSAKPYGANSDLLDYPNISIARGLQSVNGYDPVRLGQMAEIAGRMTLDGVIEEPTALSAQHQGFNLLNAKYLLRDRGRNFAGEPVMYDGIRFQAKPMNLILSGGQQTRLYTRAAADELAIVSSLGNATEVADGTTVLRVRLLTADGRVIERELQAGRDTSAWDYERPETLAAVKHQRARVVEMPWGQGLPKGVNGRRYLARLKFDPAEIESVEMVCPLAGAFRDVDVDIARAALFNSATQASRPLDAFTAPPERWRKLAEFGDVELYENLKAMPRAWVAARATLLPSKEVLRAIKTGKLPDGSLFDPASTVLLESELFSNRADAIRLSGAADAANPGAQVKVTEYRPDRIQVRASASQPGFLVLSEIYYRGWEARVDGARASVDRVNFTLRGVSLPPGDHKVEFTFRAHSFRNGAAWSAVGLLLLCVGGVAGYLKRK